MNINGWETMLFLGINAAIRYITNTLNIFHIILWQVTLEAPNEAWVTIKQVIIELLYDTVSCIAVTYSLRIYDCTEKFEECWQIDYESCLLSWK